MRSLSDYEFSSNADELRLEVLSVVSSSAIPKSRRFTFAVPMAETAREIVVEIERGEAYYPNTPGNVEARKSHYTLAIAACNALMRDVQALIEDGKRKGCGTHARSFARLAELADREIALLKGARSRVRLLSGGGKG